MANASKNTGEPQNPEFQNLAYRQPTRNLDWSIILSSYSAGQCCKLQTQTESRPIISRSASVSMPCFHRTVTEARDILVILIIQTVTGALVGSDQCELRLCMTLH